MSSIVVVGGYGVFGERLVRLLCRDGHRVWVAGRSAAKAQRLADAVGATALEFDRDDSLDAIVRLGVDVLVDAAGPFHAYGAEPYRLAQACLAAGVNYLDLSDDARFCRGIGTLDGLARAHDRHALSGVSSVPALSAAAVRALSHDLIAIELIDSAILPGNRAPRGRSVIASILSQCGAPRLIWQSGRWTAMRGWSDPRSYSLGAWGRRRAWLIGAPDLDLFPKRFGARSVSFRAGLELPIMNIGLALLARLRARWPFEPPGWLIAVAHWGAGLLWPFGSARGGMVVEVIGRRADQPESERIVRRWTLLADAGDGPFVPAIAVRALLRGAMPSAGARACVDELSLEAAESAMSDLAISFVRAEQTLIPLFYAVASINWSALPAPVRDSHHVFGCRAFAGRASVERGEGWWAKRVADLFGFPPVAEDIEVEVLKTRRGDVERWTRRFGERCFHSELQVCNDRMRERFGPFRFELDLQAIDGALHFPVRRGWLLGIPLPRWMLPTSVAREFVEDGCFHFDVALTAPLGIGRMVRYRGWLAPTGPPQSE